VKESPHLGLSLALLLLLGPSPSRFWTWYLWMMMMATRTSALGRVEAETEGHQADEQRAYSFLGESLHPKKKKHRVVRKKKSTAKSHLGASSKEGGFAHMRC
jgi:hypothetical protein